MILAISGFALHVLFFCHNFMLVYNIKYCCILLTQYNLSFDANGIQVQPGSIHHFPHLKIPVPSQEYDSICLFVWCAISFYFAIWLGTFRFECSSEISIFMILLFSETENLQLFKCIASSDHHSTIQGIPFRLHFWISPSFSFCASLICKIITPI